MNIAVIPHVKHFLIIEQSNFQIHEESSDGKKLTVALKVLLYNAKEYVMVQYCWNISVPKPNYGNYTNIMGETLVQLSNTLMCSLKSAV